MNESTANQLPDSVPTGGNRSWRPAKGKIVRGREEDGSLEERPALLGYLRRVTVHYDTLQDGSRYGKLECELETNTGPEVFGANVLNPTNGKPTLSSSVTLAQALLECAAGELVQVEVHQSTKPNRFGTLSTYVRVTGVDPATLRATARKARREDGEQGPQWDGDYLDELLERLRSHPAYADRPAREPAPSSDQDDDFDPFAEE